MLFSSISFLFFMTVVFLLYWALPHPYRWPALLAANVFFYASWDIRFLAALVFTTAVSYGCALFMEKASASGKKKALLVSGILVTMFFLLFFKYANFTIYSVQKVLKLFAVPIQDTTLNLIMPFGISFYTFQMVGYLADVYKGKIKAEHHFGKYALFVSFFPNISSGPIERAGRILPQIDKEKQFDYDTAVYGMRLILLGLLKKLVFADSMSKYVDIVFDDVTNHSGICFIIATLLFTFQIYCDFSGYTDIAIGAAKLLGFDLMTNFKSPYWSSSIKEFWSRWHISLSTWFRDYVYIPLGGNRVSKAKRNRNLMVTFLASGLWHGASWTFVLWGGIHGLCQVAEDTIKEFHVKKRGGREHEQSGQKRLFASHLKHAGSILLTFCIVSFAWMFFRANSISDVLYILRHMFTGGSSFSDAMSQMSMSRMSVVKTGAAI
ncbi:MAG TPA: MBOAT family O-acyltransferase, partial [Lachnospiraceae bacterium]|nr:MBOAT family O-acyltransferase [Lachnospiraceae bacterium]